MKYSSRIDVLNIITLLISIAILSLPNFVFNFSWVYFSIMLVFDLYLIVLTFMTSYTLTKEELVIQAGFLKFGISYDSIRGVTKTKAWRNQSCSTSIRCVEIRYGVSETRKYNKINISPQNEDDFITNILSRCGNNIIVEDKRSGGKNYSE